MVGRKVWRVEVTAPSGVSDHGTITLLSTEMGSQELAHRIADQAWRLAYDLSDAEAAAEAAAAAEPGELTRERVSD